MKEHKSHMSMVARFAYIFVTIVTVFAQIGSAVPALIAEADDTPKAFISTSGMTLKYVTHDKYLYTAEISGTKPADGQSFKVSILGTGMTLTDVQTNKANGEGMINDKSTTIKTYTGWRVSKSGENELIITRDDDYKGSDATKYDQVKTSVPWPITLKFILQAGTGGLQLDGQDTPVVMNEQNTLALSVFNNGPTTYQVGDEVDLQLNDQNMISGGEADVSKAAVSQYLKYDADKTATLLAKQGYSKSAASASDVSEYADDASSSTITKYTKSDTDYFYLIDNNGDARVVWPPSNGQRQRNALIAMQAVGETSSVNLTPTYLSSALKGQDGTGVDLTIKAAPDVDGSVLRLDPHSVANDNPAGTGTYRISTFPLFYMKETADNGTQLYSFLYNFYSTGQNGNPTHSLETLRKAIIAGDPYTSIKGGAESTTLDYSPRYWGHEIASGRSESNVWIVANTD